MKKLKLILIAVTFLAAPLMAQAGGRVFVDNYGRIHREQTETSRAEHIVTALFSTGAAIWAYNAGWKADHAHTRDYVRAGVIISGLRAVIHFGGAVAQ
jgi:cytochrome bd-type quinol oxidase subunit 1